MRTSIDFDRASAGELRKLYRAAMTELGRPCDGIGKMNRSRLLRKLSELVNDGAIRVEPEKPAENPPPARDVRPDKVAENPLPEPLEQCLRCMLEALRCYSRHEAWAMRGLRKDPRARRWYDEARAHARKAVEWCSEAGDGWDRGLKVGVIVDRAMARMRYDFCDMLVASSVMSELMAAGAEEKGGEK
jgi:hypothetical protein